MEPFSEPTLRMLSKAGWSEEYRHDTAEDERLLLEAGYPVFSVVLEFLHYFGGITFIYPDPINVASKYEASFNIPKILLESDLLEYVEYDSKALERPLCLIGEYVSGNMWLMMDEQENVFSSFGEGMRFVGHSGSDAIEALCTKRPSPLV